MEPIPDDSIFQINEELFWRNRLPKMSARELFDRIHRLFPDHCESVLMLRRLMGEAYRRLNEADALRKENEALRKLLGECPKRNRLGSYTQMQPMQIDVCKLLCNTKESEASHE